MFRALFYITIGFFLAYALLRRVQGVRAEHASGRPQNQPDSQPAYRPMVNCPVCGVHLPTTNAISHKGHYYCSNEHASQSH